MPGPMSDSYDPEWGTSAKRSEIAEKLSEVYDIVTKYPLRGSKPIDIRQLVDLDMPRLVSTTLSEKEWRLIRFALERARESL